MAIKEYDITAGVVKRFLRTFIPQIVLVLPIMVKYAAELQEVLPLWILPVLVFIASVVTAIDKLIRELRKL